MSSPTPTSASRLPAAQEPHSRLAPIPVLLAGWYLQASNPEQESSKLHHVCRGARRSAGRAGLCANDSGSLGVTAAGEVPNGGE